MVLGEKEGVSCMDIADFIQIFIAIVMLLQAGFFYLSMKRNTSATLTNTFTNLTKEDQNLRTITYSYKDRIDKTKSSDRKQELIEESDVLLFTFYDYIALLYFQNEISEDVFFDYFGPKIGYIYNTFMDSTLFEHSEDRYRSYPNLCTLFNSMSLSIQEKPRVMDDEDLDHY